MIGLMKEYQSALDIMPKEELNKVPSMVSYKENDDVTLTYFDGCEKCFSIKDLSEEIKTESLSVEDMKNFDKWIESLNKEDIVYLNKMLAFAMHEFYS